MGTGQPSFANPKSLASRLRPPAIALGVLALGAWLFGDTYHRHFGQRRAPDVIRFAHFGTYQDYLFWKHIVADFNEGSNNFRVEQEYVAGLSGHYRTKLRQRALVGNLPDVALVQLAFFREHAELFEDMSQLVSEIRPDDRMPPVLDPVGLEAFQKGGVQRGLPISGGPLVIYGNKKCFRKVADHVGAPLALPAFDWTMSDFQKTTEFLTRDFDEDGITDQFGFFLPRWVYYLPFIWSHGATFTDSSAVHWTFRGQHAKQAMTLYQQLALTRRVTPRDHEVAQLFQDTAFLTGRIALCVNGPWFQPFLEQTTLRNDYFVLPIPRGPAGSITRITWDGVVVARALAPEHHTNAMRFAHHLLSRDVQQRIATTGKALPARGDVISDFAAHPDAKMAFTAALQTARLQPPWPSFSEIDRAINRHFYDLTRQDSKTSPALMIKALASDPVITANFAVNPEQQP